jgi:asparagine synthase (glutamine-hydrolysing)
MRAVSGLVGIVALVSRSISPSAAWLKHRGLGQVRLSIIDLSPEGNQPFHDQVDDIHAVVNGELYDFEKYRAELSQVYSFKGHSDCEIVLALYKHYGLAFMYHLRGEFALVIYDAKRKLLVSVRDRYGIKSLYYTVYNGRLLIATEMKSFLAYGWKPEWDVQSLRENSWRCRSRTIFKGVRKARRPTFNPKPSADQS